MPTIDYDWGEGNSTGMNYDIRDSNTRRYVREKLFDSRGNPKTDMRNLTVDGKRCSQNELYELLED